ncbi:MAG: hypothetical protein M5U34_17010 [Chloroflexi bacterium]|nr:hypothetical protein [Chloroflexota bacterium]
MQGEFVVGGQVMQVLLADVGNGRFVYEQVWHSDEESPGCSNICISPRRDQRPLSYPVQSAPCLHDDRDRCLRFVPFRRWRGRSRADI